MVGNNTFDYEALKPEFVGAHVFKNFQMPALVNLWN